MMNRRRFLLTMAAGGAATLAPRAFARTIVHVDSFRRPNMIINAIIYTFSPNDAERAAELLRQLRDAAKAEPGCVRFDVARSINEPNVFALFEEYVDQAALDAHLASDSFNRFGINGIRKLAKERVGHTCRPLD